MYWPFKTTVRFQSRDGMEARLDYLVSAGNMVEAKNELQRRFVDEEIIGYKVESVVAATKEEAAAFLLPAGCIMLLR